MLASAELWNAFFCTEHGLWMLDSSNLEIALIGDLFATTMNRMIL